LGKRAGFIKAIEDAEAAEEARKKAWAESAWHVVPEDTPFKKEAERLGLEPRYLRDLNASRLKGLQLSSFLKSDTWLQIKPLEEVTPMQSAAKPAPIHLVNRVVQIDGEDDYEYWYVLTYLPDLQWCHVAPLEKRGVFSDTPGPSGHVATGRPCWMLVSEEEGGEIDVGAGRCHVMQAIEMKGTKANADTEEWDLIGRAPPGWVPPPKQGDPAAKAKKGKKASAEAPAMAAATPAGDGDGSCSTVGSGCSSVSTVSASVVGSTDTHTSGPLSGTTLSRCVAVLSALGKHKDAEAFLDPVDWEALGLSDYPEIVKRPMDLGTVEQRLDAGQYATVSDLAADVALVWDNAMVYNGEDNWVHQAALKMKAVAERKFAPLLSP